MSPGGTHRREGCAASVKGHVPRAPLVLYVYNSRWCSPSKHIIRPINAKIYMYILGFLSRQEKFRKPHGARSASSFMGTTESEIDSKKKVAESRAELARLVLLLRTKTSEIRAQTAGQERDRGGH